MDIDQSKFVELPKEAVNIICELNETITKLRDEIEQLKSGKPLFTSPQIPAGMMLVPIKLFPKITPDGIGLGNYWISHEAITGNTAEQLNSGDTHIIGRQYMKYINDVKAMLEASNETQINKK